MNRIAVKSSNLVSVGWDKESLTLEVEFKRGKTYQYVGVSKGMYDDLLRSASVGAYFDTFVRGKFPFKIVGYGTSTAGEHDKTW